MIRSIKPQDKEQWQKLYNAYAQSSNTKVNDKDLNTVWEWLVDDNHAFECLVYVVEDKLVAFAHYMKMPRALSGKDIGFLDDLFVDTEHRGKRIGEKLLARLKQIAEDSDWDFVRWISRQSNTSANKLYQRIAEKTNWDLYELK